MNPKWRSIALLCGCQVLVLALWFSASAAVPSLSREYSLAPLQIALFTSSVQIGFVAGTLVSAVLTLADRLRPKLFFTASAMCAAAANALILVVDPTSSAVPFLRFMTGAAMAGVYPVGMRMAATWAKGDMGLMVGLLVGALTLGSASPHLFNALGGLGWRFTIAAASLSAAAGAVLIQLFEVGPNLSKAPRFQPSLALHAWRSKAVRLANFGYFGHMWEVYAMWAWIGVFLEDSFARSLTGGSAGVYARLATFLTIAAGAVGSLVGGIIADRVGRTMVTMVALLISGSCCLAVGLLFAGNAVLLTGFCMLWGFAVVADSAQFSASIAELSPPELVGTMLTVQTSIGFFLTLVTIHLTPYIRDWVGWPNTFLFLAIGPAFGIWAMGRLRRMDEARKLAGGRM